MKYLKSLTLKMCVIAAALLLASPAVAVNSNGRGTKVKTVYQDTDPSAPNYLKNRRALVGPGCTVNSVGAGVSVASGLKDLKNLCNNDLDDYATFPSAVEAVVAGSPIVSIIDKKNYYAAGTEAGFTFCDGDASVLKLDLAGFYKIQFLKDGVPVGDLQTISQGKNITGLNLSLVSIPTDKGMVNKSYVATAPGEFNEIKLVQFGVNVEVLKTIKIKYAFVGKANEYTLTNNTENGIAKYAKDYNRGKITLSADDKLIDTDLTNHVPAAVSLIPIAVDVEAIPSDGQEVFPAGTEIGFKYNVADLLSLGIGKNTKITLYSKNKKGLLNKNIETESFTVSVDVLSLGVISGKKEAEVVIKSTKPFSKAELFFGGLDVKLGITNVYYAFVRMAPDLATHHCAIEANSSRDVCGCENEYQLTHNASVPVTWSLVSQPADSNISLNEQTGKVTNIYVPGDYTFMATAADGCTETTTIHYAPYYDPAEHGVTLLTNNASETKYELSGNNGGALLQIFGGIENASNVLNSSLNDYASVKAGVSLVENTGIIGIKSVDKSALNKNIDKTHKMQAGFVVTFNSTVLDLKALNLYNIQLYKDGKKVAGGVATHWGAISAGLIGSEDTQKMRMSIDVPAGTDFDEIVLFNSGVIDAKLAKPNIYYAYVCDDEMDNASNNALYGTELVSVDGTDASINWDKTNILSLANIGNGLNGISNLIDNSIETGLTFPLGISANRAYVTVNVGKIVDKGQKIIMVSEDKELGLGVKLIKAIKLTTCLNGVDQEELTDWKVLGADVIGTGGKQYATLKPTKSFNQIRLTVVGSLNLADNIKVYGLALGSDINEDGTSTDCPEEFLVLDEDETLDDSRNLTKATMVFHRTFTTGKWNSLILPVDMTADQVKAAFGAEAKIARFDRLEDKWIYFDMQAENNLRIEKNVPYIIKPTKQPTAVNRTYNVGGEKTKHINGLVYTVTGIAYNDQTATLKHEDTEYTNGMTHYGSYENPTVVPADSYILHRSGDMVHTAVEHKNIKSYRTWLRETTPSGETLQMRVEQNDGPSTGIKVIEETAKNANAVYNVNGMRMNSSNTNNLPKGVYIINNKKVVIK